MFKPNFWIVRSVVSICFSMNKASVSFHFLCIVFIQVFHRFQQGYEYTLLSLRRVSPQITQITTEKMK